MVSNISKTKTDRQKFKKYLIHITIFLLIIIFIIWNIGVSKFFKYLILGLPQGGIIALIAIGYSMVYGIVQLINFAHGEVFMISAYIVFTLSFGGTQISPNAPIILAIFIGFTFFSLILLLFETRIKNKFLVVAFSLLASVVMCIVAYSLFHNKINFWLACIISVLITAILGISMDQYAYKPLRKSPRLVPLITAIGISLFLSNFAQIVWGSQSRTFSSDVLPKILTVPYMINGEFLNTDKIKVMPFIKLLTEGHRIRITENLILPLVDVIIFSLAVVLMICVQIFLMKTKTGKAMRACSQDIHAAKLMGINVDRIISTTFAVGSALAALCSPLYVIKYAPLEPSMGYIVGILAFASAVLGGIGNIPGAMLGGFFIGIIYNFVPLFETLETWKIIELIKESGFLPFVKNWNFLSGITQWRLGIAFTFMLVVILIKPQGLLGAVEAKKRA